MLKVWTHRGQWEPGRAKFSTWLYRVVTNRCIDLRRRPRTDNVDAVPEPMDGTPDAFNTMQRDEVTKLLETAMQRLPEHSAAVILRIMKHSNVKTVMSTTLRRRIAAQARPWSRSAHAGHHPLLILQP
jgi:RNA polymerase sigma-70 factor (ECF subfamily)